MENHLDFCLWKSTACHSISSKIICTRYKGDIFKNGKKNDSLNTLTYYHCDTFFISSLWHNFSHVVFVSVCVSVTLIFLFECLFVFFPLLWTSLPLCLASLFFLKLLYISVHESVVVSIVHLSWPAVSSWAYLFGFDLVRRVIMGLCFHPSVLFVIVR